MILLLEAAIYDADFADVERQTILDILCDHYEMTPEEAEHLIEVAGQHRERFADIHTFTREIARLEPEDRLEVMYQIWQVVYADEKLEAMEEHYARKMQKLLRLDHSQWIAAKQRVLKDRSDQKKNAP